MILFPHAKINIGLDITGKLPNGYHLIETVMAHTRWEDALELVTAPHGRTTLTVTGRKVDCPPEKNLVMRAFDLLNAATGGLPPTHMYLQKNIPDGAGLGGGSADAAYTLRGLNELYNLGFSRKQLAELASQLGADCPFFVYDEPMLCTGIGTDLSPVDLPVQELSQMSLAIVKPPFGVNTAEAYSGVRVRHNAEPLARRVAAAVDGWQGSVTNAFEDSVIPRHPQIGKIKAELLTLGAVYASMSGSGSAVFGIFPRVDSEAMTDMLRNSFAGCDVFAQTEF